MSLLFITAPSKTMDESEHWDAAQTSQPTFSDQANKLAQFLQYTSQKELKQILRVSDSITKKNYQRYQSWQNSLTSITGKPAVLLYKGDIYKQFDATKFSKKEQSYAQESLRIITGLYGILKAYDLIQPYRLEMKSKVSYTGEQSLANFWSDRVTKALNHSIKEQGISAVINLASKEYAKAVNSKNLMVPYITAEFKENKNGKLVNIPIYSKQARGLMIGWMIKNQIENVEQLQDFKEARYCFIREEQNSILFTRTIK